VWNKITLHMDLPPVADMTEVSTGWANAFAKQLSRPYDGHTRYRIEVDILLMTATVRPLSSEECEPPISRGV
jgi:hypothetical protein